MAGQVLGCTVGVVRVPGGMLFFKNRDLEGPYLARRVTVFESTAEIHALRGGNLQTGELEGVSIGVNRHRVCVANTHILSMPGVTYDLLCERLLHEVRDRGDVSLLVEAFVAAHEVQGGRILVAAPDWAYLVEVLDDRHAIQAVEGSLAITNTFCLLPQPPGRAEVHDESSASRLRQAGQAVPAITGLGSLKALLRSHLPDKGDLSICNHRPDGGGTEGSYIVQIQGEYVGWSTLLGFPCENDYHLVQLFQG
ncbi:MAG: hypothetical protein EHM56_03190 [Chloroflexi bacterium]|nr:MAG: hypothetical protein EHM56_03190 [Chloroflexota bacterium]